MYETGNRKPMIRGESGWGTVHSGEMFKLLGLAGSHLPAEGMPSREIQGIRVWVEPKGSPNGRKSSTHRVKAECPVCAQVLSVGRLHQHVCDKK